MAFSWREVDEFNLQEVKDLYLLNQEKIDNNSRFELADRILDDNEKFSIICELLTTQPCTFFIEYRDDDTNTLRAVASGTTQEDTILIMCTINDTAPLSHSEQMRTVNPFFKSLGFTKLNIITLKNSPFCDNARNNFEEPDLYSLISEVEMPSEPENMIRFTWNIL
jgi:hypothetical protein